MTTVDTKNTTKNRLLDGLSAASGLFDLLLPPACRLCNKPIDGGKEFCRTCELGLTLSEPMMVSACARCGRPGAIQPNAKAAQMLELTAPKRAENENSFSILPLPPCAHCKREKFEFDQVIARWTYQGRVCDAVIAAKYARQAALGDSLGVRLGQRVVAAVVADPPDAVTYVPSHVLRQFTRGGNGIRAIATAVVKSLRDAGHPVRVETLLRMTRKIKKQAWLTDVERRENVRGAFAAKKSYAWPRFPGVTNQHILLVDDVLTTGATANEVARVLRSAGARRVTLAVVARAVWSA